MECYDIAKLRCSSISWVVLIKYERFFLQKCSWGNEENIIKAVQSLKPIALFLSSLQVVSKALVYKVNLPVGKRFSVKGKHLACRHFHQSTLPQSQITLVSGPSSSKIFTAAQHLAPNNLLGIVLSSARLKRRVSMVM